MLRRRKKPRKGTKTGIDNLLAFLPDFEAGRFDRVQVSRNRTGDDPPNVEALCDALQHSTLINGPEWTTYLDRALFLMDHPDEITRLSREEMRIILTFAYRMDRLVGGIITSACQHGVMHALLKRLQTLRDDGAFD